MKERKSWNDDDYFMDFDINDYVHILHLKMRVIKKGKRKKGPEILVARVDPVGCSRTGS